MPNAYLDPVSASSTDTAAPRPRRPYAARVPVAVRREQLLDAALAIVVRDGYYAVSIESVAREAEVTRPVVYGIFEGLKELVEALLDRQQVRALAQLGAVLPANPDLTDLGRLIEETARRLIDLVVTDPMTWHPILFAHQGMPELARQRIEDDRENFLAQLAAVVGSVLSQPGAPVLDAEVTAHSILAVLEHFGRLLLVDPDRFGTERLIGSLTQLMTALRPSPPG